MTKLADSIRTRGPARMLQRARRVKNSTPVRAKPARMPRMKRTPVDRCLPAGFMVSGVYNGHEKTCDHQ